MDQDNVSEANQDGVEKAYKKFYQCATYEEYLRQFADKPKAEEAQAEAKAKDAVKSRDTFWKGNSISLTQRLMKAQRMLQSAEDLSKSMKKYRCKSGIKPADLSGSSCSTKTKSSSIKRKRKNNAHIENAIIDEDHYSQSSAISVGTKRKRKDNAHIVESKTNSDKKTTKSRKKRDGTVKHCTTTTTTTRTMKDKKNSTNRTRKRCPVLTAAQKKLDIYKRVSDDNTWKAPPSQHKLLQEEHSYDPWRVLVICKLLNQTQGKQASKVLTKLFNLIPNAEAATQVSEESIRDLIRPLGLYNKRAIDIKILSSQYLSTQWTHVPQLHGVGKYAADAYALFCVGGKPEDVNPWDHKLVDYWKFLCEKHAGEEQG